MRKQGVQKPSFVYPFALSFFLIVLVLIKAYQTNLKGGVIKINSLKQKGTVTC